MRLPVRVLILLAVALLLSTAVSANLGIRGGTSISSGNVGIKSAHLGWHISMFFATKEVGENPFGFQFEVGYDKRGARYSNHNLLEAHYVTFSYLLKFKLDNLPVRLFVGVEPGMLVASNNTVNPDINVPSNPVQGSPIPVRTELEAKYDVFNFRPAFGLEGQVKKFITGFRIGMDVLGGESNPRFLTAQLYVGFRQ